MPDGALTQMSSVGFGLELDPSKPRRSGVGSAFALGAGAPLPPPTTIQRSTALSYPAATLDALRSLGYTVPAPADIGSVQAVVADPKTGKQYGGADPRREGTVIGLPRAQGGK